MEARVLAFLRSRRPGRSASDEFSWRSSCPYRHLASAYAAPCAHLAIVLSPDRGDHGVRAVSPSPAVSLGRLVARPASAARPAPAWAGTRARAPPRRSRCPRTPTASRRGRARTRCEPCRAARSTRTPCAVATPPATLVRMASAAAAGSPVRCSRALVHGGEHGAEDRDSDRAADLSHRRDQRRARAAPGRGRARRARCSARSAGRCQGRTRSRRTRWRRSRCCWRAWCPVPTRQRDRHDREADRDQELRADRRLGSPRLALVLALRLARRLQPLAEQPSPSASRRSSAASGRRPRASRARAR